MTLFAFCVLVEDLLGAMHNLAQSLLLSLSPSFSLSSHLYPPSRPPLLPPFLLCDLQVYFTTWFPQCPPISLGRRCPPLEASALCSVSPPLPLPPPKPSSTSPPNQPPRALPPCPHLSLSPCPRHSTAASSQSFIALLLPRSPYPLFHPCTAPPPPLPPHPHILTPHHPLDQTPSIPPVCPTPLSTTREHIHRSLTQSLPPHLPRLLLSLLLLQLLPSPPPPPPLCQPPPCLVHSQCTIPLGCPLHHQPTAQVVAGACGGLRACMAPTQPPSSLAPDLDRVWR